MEKHSMKCPACKKNNVIVIEFEGVEVDQCVDCGGVWFDRDELDMLLAKQGLSPEALRASVMDAAGGREKGRRCPVCGRRMEKVFMGKKDVITVDQCGSDGGYWFDADELRRLIQQEPPGGGTDGMVSYLNSVFQPGKD
jgi:Zn-finger nucleic acid-binding protein